MADKSFSWCISDGPLDLDLKGDCPRIDDEGETKDDLVLSSLFFGTNLSHDRLRAVD